MPHANPMLLSNRIIKNAYDPVALIRKGVHAKVIQEILGHSSIVITMGIYGHVFPSMQQDAMTYMDEFLRAM